MIEHPALDKPTNRTGGPQAAAAAAASSSSASPSSSNGSAGPIQQAGAICNYTNAGPVLSAPADRMCQCSAGQRNGDSEQARSLSLNVRWQHIIRGPAATSTATTAVHSLDLHSALSDGLQSNSGGDGCGLSSAADLNCRHLIRSPVGGTSRAVVAAAAAAAAAAATDNARELEVEYCPVPLTSCSSSSSSSREKKQDNGVASDGSSRLGRGGGSLFKRAASYLRTTKLPSFLTYHSDKAPGGSGGKITTSLVSPARGSIKSEQQQQQQQTHSNLQRRPGKTIKSLVASNSSSINNNNNNNSNWSRLNSDQPQPINTNQDSGDEDCKQQQLETTSFKLAQIAARQDADSLQSDTVVLFSSKLPFHRIDPTTNTNSNQQQQQHLQKAIKLRNSHSCELSSLYVHQPPKSSSSSTKLVNESNINEGQIGRVEIRQQQQQQQQGRRRRTRRLSSVQRVKLQSSSIESASDMSASRAGGQQQGLNLAKNRYIIEDRAAMRKLHRQSDEVNSQSFIDERRSTICSSSCNVTDIRDDSCDFSCSNHNNNNNNTSNNNPGGESEISRQGNSNDCKNPSQAQSAGSLVNVVSLDQQQQQQQQQKSHRKQSSNNGKRGQSGSRCSLDGKGLPKRGGSPNGSKRCRPRSRSSSRSSSPPRASQGGEQLQERENWSMNIEFLLAVIGFAVDLGNIWRFPYICYRNGGGAFLIPYTILFILGGLPIFYLEMSLGQYFSSGCLTVWADVCPMGKGIGYAMCVLNFYTGLYYNTIISWAVFFMIKSFTWSLLPWISCHNLWNTAGCKTIDQRLTYRTLAANGTLTEAYLENGMHVPSFNNNNNTTPLESNYSTAHYSTHLASNYSSPTKEYFEREVLQVHLSTGIDDLGSIRTPLAFYLAIVFVCIYFAIWKGVKSTGKAVWITALLPYFVLIPLLIRGVFLEGAWLGIRYYLEPQWEKIFDVDVWVEAAKQIYFSLGPGFGTLMALSSYNKFHHNCRRDAFIAASVNYFASFIAGLVVFALLGYMATIQDVNISDVATEGPGLVFQVYPEGLATMSFSSMWSVLFFIMVITLGIDSTFGGLESVITGLCDEYPRTLRAHRGTFIGILIVLIYICSLPTTTNGGQYVIYLLESYGTSLSLIFIVLVETIVVCWIYGTDRFCGNLERMYGERPGLFWRICWKYISPSILLLIFFAACIQEFGKYHVLTNENGYIYPSWAPTLGLLMTGSSICCIPIYAIYYMKTKTSGTFFERLKIASKPECDTKPRTAEKDIYGDAMIDKISDENDIHLNVVI